MPLHSIIIPSLNRDKHLSVCLASIHHSAQVCGVPITDFEIVVAGETMIVERGFRLIQFKNVPSVELGPNEAMPYHKTAALNTAMDCARGDVFSFLDADAVVGPRWMENVKRLEQDDTLTKLAYRVKYATFTRWDSDSTTKTWQWAFENWDDLAGCPVVFEAYGQADNDWAERIRKGETPVGPRYGNSQFSIRRDKLYGLRFDERYIGRGFDDIHFNRAIAEYHGVAYRCEIVTDGPRALFHIKHPQSPGFEAGDWNRRNERLYRNQSKTYYVCPDVETAEDILAKNPHAETVTPGNEWQLSRAIAGLDAIICVAGKERAA